MKSFEAMANEDPEISHMMAYRRVRQIVRLLDVFHRSKTKRTLKLQINDGGVASLTAVNPEKLEPCSEWEAILKEQQNSA